MEIFLCGMCRKIHQPHLITWHCAGLLSLSFAGAPGPMKWGNGERSRKKTNTVGSHLHVESKVIKFMETERGMVVARGLGKWETWIKGNKLSVIR